MDTIAALSSGSVPSGVAVIRVSGPRARWCVEALTRSPPPAPGTFELRSFRDAEDVLDKGLLLWFEAPRSFTGEDVAEFQTHGGRAVVDGMLEAIVKVEGVRYAEAGEFSKQAFLNGRLDLTEVEGLADLIQAETSLQRRQAFSQMNGVLADLYEDWRSRLIRALGHVEAEIDFADEDLPDDLSSLVKPIVDGLIKEMSGHLEQAHKGERMRDGFRVALYGAPNAGKSSLLNALAQRDVAIVSAQPGTTRDALEVHLNLGGIPVTVIDTAGLRESSDEVEQIGVARGRAKVEEADLKVLVQDSTASIDNNLERGQRPDPDLIVLSKIDLTDDHLEEGRDRIPTSTLDGTGIGSLCDRVQEKLSNQVPPVDTAVPTRLRHRESLERCVAALSRTNTLSSSDPDLLAEELRSAMTALGEITGRAGVEDMLDVVFRDFCIGK